MAIADYVAQFGKRGTGNAGAGIAYGLQAQNMRNQNQRYEQQRAQQEQMAKLQEQRDYIRSGVEAIQSVPANQRQFVYQGMMAEAARRGYDVADEPTEWSDEMLPRLMGAAGVAAPKAPQASVSQQDRDALFSIIQDPNTPEWQKRAARIDLGLDPRAVGSSAMTIANTGQTGTVAGSEATIAGAKAGASEKAKLEAQSSMLPDIRGSIKEAEIQAQSRGETLTELSRMEAAWPGLMETVGQLKELTPMATYTAAGKFFDEASKQLGFGTTEGANSRAKYIAIIDNQVLPLLRETFGAAFTVEEGNRLRDTLGDPDASPEQKNAQLDAFIAQKRRDIQSRNRELGESDLPEAPPVEGARRAPDGNWYVQQNGQYFRVD